MPVCDCKKILSFHLRWRFEFQFTGTSWYLSGSEPWWHLVCIQEDWSLESWLEYPNTIIQNEFFGSVIVWHLWWLIVWCTGIVWVEVCDLRQTFPLKWCNCFLLTIEETNRLIVNGDQLHWLISWHHVRHNLCVAWLELLHYRKGKLPYCLLLVHENRL